MFNKHVSEILIVGGIFFMAVLSSCSTSKNTFFSRSFHNTTTKYNWYFNANESFKAGVKKLENNRSENFNEVLPIFVLPSKNEVQSISSNMDRAIKKSASAIAKHSMMIKGQEKNKTIDDCYLLIGKAYLYKQDFIKAIEAFRYTSKQFEGLYTAHQANIFLARTYIANKDFASAELVFDQLLSDETFPVSLNKELSKTLAEFSFQQGDFSNSIVELKAALKESNKKQEKIRLSYILAQLYYLQENYAEATNYYKSVIKKGPKYDFEFNAKINLARSFDVSNGNNKEIESELTKMIKDKKNKEYLDVIYFGLAELKLRQGLKNEAIPLYALSVSKSVNNDPQKALSSLTLGRLYYNDQLYRPSQAYYDTAVAFMNSKNKSYDKAQKRKNTLTDLIENLDVISQQDSLQKIASMSESERLNVIDKIIADLKEAERLEKIREQAGRNESAFLNGNQNNNRFNRTNQSRGGVWYFYNPTTLSFGFSEFNRKWGKRKLEDNWRRTNKNSFDIEEAELVELEEEFDPTNRESYLANLPLSVEQLQQSNQKIIEAYYNAAVVYKEGLDDTPKSLELFEELNKRFPKNENQARVLYFLYRLNIEVDNKSKADNYKTQLINLFPESEYAKIINDQNYLQQIQQSKTTVDVLYEQAYAYYLDQNYSSAISICNKVSKEHKGNLLTPRFDLLYALCVGGTKEKSKMILLLQKVVEKHSKHEVATSAQDLLNYLLDENQTSEKEEVSSADQYTKELNTPHYFVLIFKEYDLSQSIAKSTLSDYHSEFYSLESLNISALLLAKQTNMLSVREFKNAKKAMDYYDAFQIGDARGPFGDNYQSFVISQNNFPLFYKKKDVEEYLAVFKQFYQSGQE